MLSPRSPWLPLVSGVGLLLLGLAAWQLRGGELLARVLLTLCVPLIYEGGAWFGAAKVGGQYYGLDGKLVHSQAYDPRAALIRCALIFVLLFSILIAGEAAAFPEGFGTWVALAITMCLWIAYVLQSHFRQITIFARQKHLGRGGTHPH
jgi:hypothetical protein